MSVRTDTSSTSRSSSVIVGKDPQLLVWWQREERERERGRGNVCTAYIIYGLFSMVLMGGKGGTH